MIRVFRLITVRFLLNISFFDIFSSVRILSNLNARAWFRASGVQTNPLAGLNLIGVCYMIEHFVQIVF